MSCKNIALMSILSTAVLLTAVLFGCTAGGGAGGDAAQVYGTAAAGAPIVGTVNIRGANGNISMSAVEADGSYTVDVSALVPPFVIFVEGSANGKRVRLYSTVDGPGRANVTPATDIVVAQALGQAPDTYYTENPDAGAPSTQDVEAAKQAVQAKLASVFDSLDMPADFDLMNGEFTTDGTGFDAVLETVDMTSNSDGTVVMTDKSSGETLYKEDVSTGTVEVDKTPEEIKQIVQGSMTTIEQLEAIIDLWNLYFATENPSQELIDQVGATVSDDSLHRGMGKQPPTQPPMGVQYDSVAILRAMGEQTFGADTIDEKGTNYQGVWVHITFSFNGEPKGDLIQSFVRETGLEDPWLWYGNRVPTSSGWLNPEALCEVDAVGNGTFSSGYQPYYMDQGNVAWGKGIDSIAVVGDGITAMHNHDGIDETCLFMTRDELDTRYHIENVDDVAWPNRYDVCEGLDISAIESTEYLFFGIDDDTDEVKCVWMQPLKESPVELSALTTGMFPALAGGMSHDVEEVDVDTLVFSWQNPAGQFTDWVGAWMSNEEWGTDSYELIDVTQSNPGWSDFSLDRSEWVSQSFDLSSYDPIKVAGAGINVSSIDVHDRNYKFHWNFGCFAPLSVVSNGLIDITDPSSWDAAGVEPFWVDTVGEPLSDSLDIEKVFMVRDGEYFYWRMDIVGTTFDEAYDYRLSIVPEGCEGECPGMYSSKLRFNDDPAVNDWEAFFDMCIGEGQWEGIQADDFSIDSGILQMKVSCGPDDIACGRYEVHGKVRIQDQEEWADRTATVYMTVE